MQKEQPDFLILVSVVLLTVIGLLVLAGAAVPYSLKTTGNPNYFFIHQLLYGFLPGVILGFILFKIDLNFLKKVSFFIFVLAICLMFLVFIPGLGIESGGATRWLSIGPISFQPAEFLKIATIIYLSFWLGSIKKTNFNKNKILISFFLIITLIVLSLFLQSNLSTLVLILSIAFVIYFCADTPLWHSALIGVLILAAVIILINVAPYRIERVKALLNTESAPLEETYHLNQSLISVGSGGVFGSGLGLSLQKFGFLPQVISDSIFAVFAEETGFIGCIILISLFIFFGVRCFILAKRQRNESFKLIMIGIGFWIVFQAFINIGAFIGILPLSGTPLPFLSYGGSHLMMELAAAGLLLNISKYGII